MLIECACVDIKIVRTIKRRFILMIQVPALLKYKKFIYSLDNKSNYYALYTAYFMNNIELISVLEFLLDNRTC